MATALRKAVQGGYHNKEWGRKMHEIGLAPSSTGAPGGKETGQRVSHYIVDGGRFALAFTRLEAQGVADLFVERWSEDEKARKAKADKNKSKTPFVCPGCDQKAWAKPTARLICGECETDMECEG